MTRVLIKRKSLFTGLYTGRTPCENEDIFLLNSMEMLSFKLVNEAAQFPNFLIPPTIQTNIMKLMCVSECVCICAVCSNFIFKLCRLEQEEQFHQYK